MEAGENGQGEDGGIDGGKVITRVVGDAGGEHYGRDAANLDGGVELAQPGRPEAAKAGHDIDGRGADNDEHVAADHGDRHPEWHGQMAGYRYRKDAAHRQHDKGRHQHQLVGNRIEDSAELATVVRSVEPKAHQGRRSGPP